MDFIRSTLPLESGAMACAFSLVLCGYVCVSRFNGFLPRAEAAEVAG